MRPDRIIIGVRRTSSALLLLRALYAPFNRSQERLLVMDTRSAEFTKYAANCHAGHAHQLHERVVAPGRAGGCRHRSRCARGIGSRPAHRLPVPLPRRGLRWLLLPQGCEGAGARRAARTKTWSCEVLQRRRRRPTRRQKSLDWWRSWWRASAPNLAGRTIRALGPGLQTQHRRHARGARAWSSWTELLRRGACHGACAHDPVAMRRSAACCSARRPASAIADHATEVLRCPTPTRCSSSPSGRPSSSPDFDAIKAQLRQPLVFDGRNLYDPALMRSLGIEYSGIGRGAAVPQAALSPAPAPSASAAPARRVAYLVNQYPKPSHSFIRREIHALERLGWSVERFATRGWSDALQDPQDLAERERTAYLLRGGALALAGALLGALLRSPVRWFGAALQAWRLGWRADRAAADPCRLPGRGPACSWRGCASVACSTCTPTSAPTPRPWPCSRARWGARPSASRFTGPRSSIVPQRSSCAKRRAPAASWWRSAPLAAASCCAGSTMPTGPRCSRCIAAWTGATWRPTPHRRRRCIAWCASADCASRRASCC